VTSEVAKGLRDRRLATWQEMAALATKVAQEDRAFTALEQARWEELHEHLEERDRRLRAVLDAERRVRESEVLVVQGNRVVPGYALRARKLTRKELGC
jgi:hypothetical protein